MNTLGGRDSFASYYFLFVQLTDDPEEALKKLPVLTLDDVAEVSAYEVLLLLLMLLLSMDGSLV